MTQEIKVSGRQRIAAAFANAQKSHSAALMPYYTMGFPDGPTSVDVVEEISQYADLLELGVPFSDPLADGPTVQRSTQISLEAGTTVRSCLAMIKELRGRGVETPAITMGYYNPILAYGLENYVRDAAASGVDGFIVPDLPMEEADELGELAEQYGLALIYFLAPTSNPKRIKATAKKANGFIYLVAIVGITGTAEADAGGLSGLIQQIRDETDIPLAVGFGINTPEAAGKMGQYTDGVIVGSALIQAVDNAAPAERVSAAGTFVKSLKAGLARK
ncbi:MAG: tryptophan synthase alpha chain [Cellvibrionaceae bacterium]|jgi:tryptophan synthase alpha chain